MRIKLYPPWSNLKCLGLKLTDPHWPCEFYCDLSIGGEFGGPRFIRLYVNDGIMRRWYALTWRGWQLTRVQTEHSDACARVYRRTVRPFTMVRMFRHGDKEVISYPFVGDMGDPRVMLREKGDPTTCAEWPIHAVASLKPWYPWERANKYAPSDTPQFSGVTRP